MNSQRNLWGTVLMLMFFPMALLWIAASSYASDYAIGADLSFLKQAEDRGAVFIPMFLARFSGRVPGSGHL